MAVDDDIIVKPPFGFQLTGVVVNDSEAQAEVEKKNEKPMTQKQFNVV